MKILVMRFSSIGDIVLTTPVVRCLKLQLDAEVHYLTKASFAPIVGSNPYVHKVHSFVKEVNEVLPELKSAGFSHVVDLHHNLRSLRVKLSLGKPSSAFNKLNLEKWLLVNLGINRLPTVHIVDRYMETVKHLGVKYDGAGLDYFIPENAVVNPETLSPVLSKGNYIAFVIGATHQTKRLPREKMLDICRAVSIPIVLLGGKTESSDGEWLASQSGENVVNLCGKLSLDQSASMADQAAKVLSFDTGLMHIAAARGKQIVSIWGNTIPAFGMYPFYPDGQSFNQSIEVKGLSCRPCSKIGHKQCPKGHFRCMQEIDNQQVMRALGL